ncbi:MAG: class I SAM-dependent methyltransferase [Aeromicrobium sp.]
MPRIGGSRLTLLAGCALAGAAGVALAVLLVDSWGENLLAALGAAVFVLLVASVLRTEQHVRRLHGRLERLEKLEKRLEKQGTTQRAALRQIRPLANTVERMDAGLKDPKKFGLLREINKVSRRSFEQMQATINLFEMVDVKAAVPPMRQWAVSPDALTLLVQEMLVGRPTRIVECGSGVSTLWLALAAKQRGVDTVIVALDHEQEYADKTNRLLRLHGVDDIAQARLAPLVEVETSNGKQPWYDPAALEGLDDIGLLFVDGPPAATGPLSRFPAMPLLWDKLAATFSIVLDDMIRTDEQEIVAAWLLDHPELAHEKYDTEKGTSILRRG